jgi:putative membrane protein
MRIHRTVLALAVAAGLVVPPAVMAQQAPKPESRPAAGKEQGKGGLAQSDRKFMMEAARGGMAEVELGKLAAEKGSSDAVKQFGQRLADDHSKAATELKQLAEQKGMTLPSNLDAKHKQLRDRLAKLSGAEFDRAYVSEMVKDHKKDVADFKREASAAKDGDLKNWAGKTLPTLEDHLKQAQQLQAQVKSAPRAAR